MLSIARRLAQGICLALFCANTVCGQQVDTLSADEMRQAAANALVSGYSHAALTMADALLTRKAVDFTALIIKSQAARNIGQIQEAVNAARTAWRLADSKPQKYTAAMALAQALSTDGKRTRAQLWLRRAADAAPNDATRSVATRDFRYVRARNPWSTELRFNITPSNNINNGSVHESTQLFGLPFEFQLTGDSRALEGIEYSTGIASRYRLAQTKSSAHDIVTQFSHRTYNLSRDAKALAPNVSGSDFAFSQIALGYVYHRTPDNGLGPYSINATMGHSWYGGADYFSYVRFGGTQTVLLGDKARLTLSGSGERAFGFRAPDSDILRTDLRFMHKVGSMGSVSLSMGHSDSASVTDISDFSELRSGVNFDLAKPVLGANLGFGLQWRQRDYIRSRYDPAGRHDKEITANIDMVFTQIERYGFNPTLSIHASRTESNIGLFDSENLGVSLGIRSAF